MTEHIQEEHLILHYYGEAGESPAIEEHISECEHCRSQFRALQRLLNSVDAAPVPSRGADYGQQVWNKIARKLPGAKRGWFAFPQRWIAVAAMALLVVSAFLAGRYSLRTAKTPVVPPVAQFGEVRDGILLVSVGDHLERTRKVLAELANTSGQQLNITPEREMAGSLVEANRLYRQTANATGETGVADILDELERVLIEISNSPDDMSGAQLEQLRNRIQAQSLLFKLKIFGSQLRERGAKPVGTPNTEKL
jgi:hypothetical protein